MQKTDRTKITRQRKRGCYELDKIKSIIDECIIGHLAFRLNGSVHSIPMPFWQMNNHLYMHSSVQSRLALLSDTNEDCCVSFTIVDGFVLAKSAVMHSMNYRSAVVYGSFETVTDDKEKLQAFEVFINLIENDRWSHVRIPNRKELNAAAILKMPLTEAVAKSRTGPPHDKKADLNLNVWSGVIPTYIEQGIPVPDECSNVGD